MSDRKKAALVACSDPLTEKQAEEIRVLEGRLREEGLEAEMIQGFFERGCIDPTQKGKLLNGHAQLFLHFPDERSFRSLAFVDISGDQDGIRLTVLADQDHVIS